MQHVIVCVIVGVLLQWNNVEARPTVRELAARYAQLHPNTGSSEECRGAEIEGINIKDIEINPFNAIRFDSFKWPNNTAPYTIDYGVFTTTEIEQIEAGIADLQKLTAVNGQACISIVPRTTETDYIFVTKAGGCFSSLGHVGGRQRLSLTDDYCFRHGTIMHEFLHAFGFYHEHMRTDRDDNVIINWDNIRPGVESNFGKVGEARMTLLGTPYNYGSVMHYGAYSGAIDPTVPTIIPLDEEAEIGQRITLSPIDIERVQIHYGCIAPVDSDYFNHLSR